MTFRIIRSQYFIAASLLLLAGVLRFYKLGTWSFAGDETATLADTASLFGDLEVSEDHQYYRLPRPNLFGPRKRVYLCLFYSS